MGSYVRQQLGYGSPPADGLPGRNPSVGGVCPEVSLSGNAHTRGRGDSVRQLDRDL